MILKLLDTTIVTKLIIINFSIIIIIIEYHTHYSTVDCRVIIAIESLLQRQRVVWVKLGLEWYVCNREREKKIDK